MFLPKSSCVYILYVKSVAPSVCLAKVPFWASFGPDMKTEMGVVISMHLKHSPDYIDSTYIYIWVQGSNSLGSGVMAEIPFLTCFGLIQGK